MKKIVLLFPGQGSQYVGMGKDLSQKYPIANGTFEEANDILHFDLKKLCLEGNMAELTKTENVQPALLTVSIATFRVFMEIFGVTPLYSAGHSLGEISALVSSGAIPFADAVKIVRIRGELMKQASQTEGGGMAAISGVDRIIIEEECTKLSNNGTIVSISNYNSSEQIVVSGHQDTIIKLSQKLNGFGAKVTPLKVSAPFHCPLMQPAADKFRTEIMKFSFNKFSWPVMSNVTGTPYTNPNEIAGKLVAQITSPVQWQKSMKYLESQGVELAVELGGKKVLRNLMQKNSSVIRSDCFENGGDISRIQKIIGSGKATGKSCAKRTNTIITKCLSIAVCTKNRNLDKDEYYNGVIVPYRKIMDMQRMLEESGESPTHEQMEEAIAMLRSVFTTKKAPVCEQNERFKYIFDSMDHQYDLNPFDIGVR